jgi:septal ring factor EnvC (AmiA/AmiB activator)
VTAETDLDYMDEVASRALGNPPSPGSRAPAAEPPAGAAAGFIGRAAAHAHMGGDLSDGERMLLVKRGVLRVAHLFAKEQVVYNDNVLKALRALDRRLAAVPALLATAEADLDGLAQAVDRLTAEMSELRRAVDEGGRSRQALAEEIAALRARLDAAQP